jgi:hypothetical protein
MDRLEAMGAFLVVSDGGRLPAAGRASESGTKRSRRQDRRRRR